MQVTTPAALTLLHRWPLGQTLLCKQPQSLGGPAQPGGTIVQNDAGESTQGRIADMHPVPPSTVHGIAAWQQFDIGAHVIG
jgi:hypothetical protein